ncbi:MAG: hypothetical protein JWP38_2682 [Herbaspirillum sp.]|jgi:hypothetical protein|nr:hypothetical protein [Herbaspirillum sp.]
MKNSTPWRWIVAANCLMAASISYAADQGSGNGHPVRRAVMHHSDRAANNAFHPNTSKFRYMDAMPLHNARHIRIAVLVFKKPVAKPNQCAALKGEARYQCFALTMPT